MSQKNTMLLPVLMLLLSFSCVTVRYDEDISDYRSTIRKLEARLSANPRDAEALQDLGVIYFQTGRYKQATEYLRNALAENEEDSKTLFYLGMSLEFQNNKQSALAVYLNYTDISALSPYRRLMEGRYRMLTRELIREQIRTLLTREQELTDKEIMPNTVAVFPLIYEGKDEKFSPLGKGLSEMMINDLGQVEELRLVERIRIGALLAELRFGQTKKVDPATAPRLGKILRAGRIVAGSYNVSEKNQFRMDVAQWDVLNRKFPEATSQSDALENLFRVEKDLVFAVIDEMGITLTHAERERIQFIPTKNLHAFLMYSTGLENEDAGDYGAAAVFYRQAATLDPNFAPAKSKADAAEALSEAGGAKEKALAAAHKVAPPVAPDVGSTERDLVSRRMENLGNGIGSGFYPGQDNRKPAEEASESGAGLSELPPPPPPPPK